jgi:hypothetical protein
MMARDILAIQAAGVGIEREFSIAGSFNLDERTYSSGVLSALMIINHHQSEENRDSKRGYYLGLRVEAITDEDLKAEEDEDNEAVSAVLRNLAINYISDDDDSGVEDEDEDHDDSETEEDEGQEDVLESLVKTRMIRTLAIPIESQSRIRRMPRRFR